MLVTSWFNRTLGTARARTAATLGTATALRRLTLASLAANVAIVVTGGAVRLTGSGLGCPTWPHCTGDSYVTTPARGYHGVVEFTNRTFTSIVGILAVLCLVAVATVARGRVAPELRRTRLIWAWAVVAGIPAQAVLGGLTVLTDLNPWLVACHFLLSSALIAAAYQLWVRCRADHVERAPLAPALRGLAWVIVAVTAAVLAVGTVVTGSGPHAGDEHAKRTGLDPGAVAQLHTDLVMLLIGLSVAGWFALRATGSPGYAVRAARALVLIECAQALIGFVQYFTHLPVVLVGVHMLGACLVWLGALGLLTAVTVGPPAPSPSRAPAGDLAAAPETSPRRVRPAHRTPEKV